MQYMNANQQKKEMCDIGRNIWLRGFCAGNEGNHSLRISEDRVLCTPTGISKGFLTPEMICTIDMDGKQVDTNNKYKRTSEVMVHLAIYKKRPDVKAVIHSHPPHAVAFCIANIPLPQGIHPEAEVFLGQTVYASYATPGGPALPASFIDKITPETNTILMANHGSVNFADNLTNAYYKLEILDNYCKQLILARQLGQVNVLNSKQMTELLQLKQKFGISDSRLACAPNGCASREDQPFLTTFEGTHPVSASCECQGEGKKEDDGFEALVKAITEQILANAK